MLVLFKYTTASVTIFAWDEVASHFPLLESKMEFCPFPAFAIDFVPKYQTFNTFAPRGEDRELFPPIVFCRTSNWWRIWQMCTMSKISLLVVFCVSFSSQAVKALSMRRFCAWSNCQCQKYKWHLKFREWIQFCHQLCK